MIFHLTECPAVHSASAALRAGAPAPAEHAALPGGASGGPLQPAGPQAPAAGHLPAAAAR